jgi:hypothetical protein
MHSTLQNTLKTCNRGLFGPESQFYITLEEVKGNTEEHRGEKMFEKIQSIIDDKDYKTYGIKTPLCAAGPNGSNQTYMLHKDF